MDPAKFAKDRERVADPAVTRELTSSATNERFGHRTKTHDRPTLLDYAAACVSYQPHSGFLKLFTSSLLTARVGRRDRR